MCFSSVSDSQNKVHTVLELHGYTAAPAGLWLFAETPELEFSVTKSSQDTNSFVFDDLFLKD